MMQPAEIYACDPPLPEEPPGFFFPLGEPSPPPAPKRKMSFEWFDEAASLALSDPAPPLIEDLLDEGALSVFYGESNAGKSFVCLDMSYAVSTGGDWNGKRARRGLTIYIAAEGGRRFARRIAALKECRGNVAEPPLFALVNYPIDLRSSDADAKELLSLIRATEQQCGERCAWVIVDTLSRALAGGDENSSVDMGRIVTAADHIRAETGAHFTYVHHCGKDSARGARGHSLLRAATDTEVEIAAGSIRVTKQRDMETGAEFGFALIDVILGEDSAGRVIKSAVVEWREAVAATAKPAAKSVPASHRLFMETVGQAIAEVGEGFQSFQDGPSVNVISEEIVRERYYSRIAEIPKDGDTPEMLAERQRKAFNRAIKANLDAKRLVAGTRNGERILWLP
jgi:hypothetical protein